jgi:hypothetical protein
MPRFNHMELTLPIGSLDPGGLRDDIKRFYTEVFGFRTLDTPILKQNALLIATDPEVSQFILLTQMKNPIQSPGYDHLGFLYETRAEVDELLEKCKKVQAQDPRLQLKLYDDLDTGGMFVHAFYVKYLLPIWFDVQCMEYKPGAQRPPRSWRYS